MREPLDFLGINYYNIDFTKASETGWPLFFAPGHHDRPNTIYRWPITEYGLTEILVRIHEEYAPGKLIVTENGLSAIDNVSLDGHVHDPARIDYLHRHIGACYDAIAEGVPLKGYFAWALHDNFEWNTGFFNQFGFLYVDRKTQSRIIKDSAYWYRDVIRQNGVISRN